jgi:hypothetical protein
LLPYTYALPPPERLNHVDNQPGDALFSTRQL